jgi:hypothetical protein
VAFFYTYTFRAIHSYPQWKQGVTDRRYRRLLCRLVGYVPRSIIRVHRVHKEELRKSEQRVESEEFHCPCQLLSSSKYWSIAEYSIYCNSIYVKHHFCFKTFPYALDHRFPRSGSVPLSKLSKSVVGSVIIRAKQDDLI